MTSFQNAFLTVRNELLSQGYTPDAGSICFNKPLGGRSSAAADFAEADDDDDMLY